MLSWIIPFVDSSRKTFLKVLYMPVYSLFLNTATTNKYYQYSSKNTNASVMWNINFDDLFNGDNKIYNKCRLRYQFTSNAWTSVQGEYDKYTGYLTTSLPSKYQQVRGLNGSVLGIINPQYVGNLDASTNVYKNSYNVSTLTTNGIDINVPSGLQPLYVNLYQDNSNQSLISWSTEPEWMLLLTFELY